LSALHKEIRNIHAVFQAKTAENPHRICVDCFKDPAGSMTNTRLARPVLTQRKEGAAALPHDAATGFNG
jgi:hypothetical protein